MIKNKLPKHLTIENYSQKHTKEVIKFGTTICRGEITPDYLIKMTNKYNEMRKSYGTAVANYISLSYLIFDKKKMVGFIFAYDNNNNKNQNITIDLLCTKKGLKYKLGTFLLDLLILKNKNNYRSVGYPKKFMLKSVPSSVKFYKKYGFTKHLLTNGLYKMDMYID